MLGETLVSTGAGTLNNTLLLLPTPPSVICTGPLVAAAGTTATTWVSDQLTTEAPTPLNVTVLPPCAELNPLPLIWTCVPAAPLPGTSPFTVGFGMVNTKS